MRELRGSAVSLAHPTIVTAPGEEAPCDYGDGPMVRRPETGKYRRTRLFALTLGWSRKAVWLLTLKSSSLTCCELHEEAFRRPGGVVRVVVLDNLTEGVLAADVYDPTLAQLESSEDGPGGSSHAWIVNAEGVWGACSVPASDRKRVEVELP